MLLSLRTLRTRYLPDVSERFISDLARRGEIPAVRLGARWMFDPELVLAAISKRKEPPATDDDSNQGGR